MKRAFFTLMEVMVAATILALSVAASISVIGGARSTLMRAETRWKRAHQLANVTEFYLLSGGEDTAAPNDLLPEGFSATCELYDVEELPEEALESNNGWLLCEYHICILDSGGAVVAETFVEKVLKEEDLE